MPDTGIITTYESGVDLVVQWKIEDFFNLPETDDEYYESPDFSFEGETWHLMIYPNGWSGNDSSGHVDMGLCKHDSDRSIKQSFSLSLKTAKGEKYNEQHGTKDFDNDSWLHGFYRFIPRSELSRRRSDLVPESTLTIICTMKNSTSAGSDSNTASPECRHCKGTFSDYNLSSHQKKCMYRPTKCPNCSEVVVLEKWLNEHECQQERPEAEKEYKENSENTCVDASTQTEEKNISFNNPPEDCGFVTDINHLLKENRGVDVTFELETPNGKTKLFAHKLILAVMSSYFADEFYDKGRNDGHQVIPLKGIDPKAFEQMIRYCYGGKPSLITTEEVCALFKVAFEFKVISLQNLCHTFFKHTKIEPGNVFSILKISMEMEDKSLKDMCYQILQEKTREVTTAYELCDITPAMVYTLLKLPKLSLNSEYELIKWIFEWAKVKSEDAREYLERLLKDMNFLALRFEEFATLCKDYQGFFNSDEIASIYQNIAHAGTTEMPEWFNNDLKCRVYTGSN